MSRSSTHKSKNADSSALRFKSQDDALNYARHLVQESNAWLARNRWDSIKAYHDGEADIVCRVHVLGTGAKHDLVFSSIPPGWQAHIGKPGYFTNISSDDIKDYCSQPFIYVSAK